MFDSHATEQILTVLAYFRANYRTCASIPDAYSMAIRQACERFCVEPQGMRYRCVEGLGLNTIYGFFGLLQGFVAGDYGPLMYRITANSEAGCARDIADFFAGIDRPAVATKEEVDHGPSAARQRAQ